MFKRFISGALSIAILCAPTLASAASKPKYETSLGDPVLYWNDVVFQAIVEDHTGPEPSEQKGPTYTARALAIVHAAIFDSVNSIDQSYEPYLIKVKIKDRSDYSIDAAVAKSAHDTLVFLYPSQTTTFDNAYDTHINKIKDKSKRKNGIEVGKEVAKKIIKKRRLDGSQSMGPYTMEMMPGFHRPDPMNDKQGFYSTTWGNIKPFAIKKGSQFRAVPPPALDSAAYATAFNEVKAYGGDGVNTPTIRTQQQTYIGIYWGYDGAMQLGPPPRLYNQILRQIATQKKNTVVENARLFALVNIAQADAGISCWESKYYYNFWRPVVAIREADAGTGPSKYGDGNPATQGDVNWMPLGAPASNKSGNNFTPPFPAYPSGHATFGAAALHMIALFYGTDNIPFTFVSDELNGVTTDNLGNTRPHIPLTYTNINDAIRDNAQSRIYIGVHWQFDATEGIKMGKDISEYIYKNSLKPVKHR